jgi:glycosyltransferase involved in cell wall biosynthesis
MKLALVISSLRMGGAEGVMARLADGLCRRGHAVTLFTLDDGSAPPFYALPAEARHVPLGLAGASGGPLCAAWANLRRVRELRRAILGVRPDAALSFMDATNVLTLLAVGRDLPVVVSERVHPARYDSGRVWRALRLLAYPRAAAIAVQTADVPGFFPPRIRALCRVLPNPITAPADASLPEALAGVAGPLLIGMGRLDRQKGFDLLLDAFARVAPECADWTLAILGEGPERAVLEARRDALGLGGRAHLPGNVAQPGGVLRRASLFVLSSRFEGFPNALCEALACGVPAVAFDCPSGPAEILRDGVDGLLVPPDDVDGLAHALRRLMADTELRRSLAARAPEVLDRFGLEKTLDMWEALLLAAADGRIQA